MHLAGMGMLGVQEVIVVASRTPPGRGVGLRMRGGLADEDGRLCTGGGGRQYGGW